MKGSKKSAGCPQLGDTGPKLGCRRMCFGVFIISQALTVRRGPWLACLVLPSAGRYEQLSGSLPAFINKVLFEHSQ